jgi:putative adhesin
MTSVRISAVAQRVQIVAEPRDDVAVEGIARIRTDGDRTTIDEVRSRVTVRVPVASDIVIGTTTGRVEVTGPVGDVSVVAESGRITIEEAYVVDARTTSGRVTIVRAHGECRVRSTNGRIEIGACGGADVATGSGRIDLEHVSGPVRAHCVSGRVVVALDAAGDVDAETVSGRIDVVFPPGVRAHRVDGPGLSPAPAGYDCVVRARSATGRVSVSNR